MDVWGGLAGENNANSDGEWSFAPPAKHGQFHWLSKESISAVVEKKRGVIRKCYDRVLKKSPGLVGTLTTNIKIAATGSVLAATGSGFPDERVTLCVIKHIKKLKFPEFDNERPMNIRYPFVFNQE